MVALVDQRGALFPARVLEDSFLHEFLKIRNRCRNARERHTRVWDVYRTATIGCSAPRKKLEKQEIVSSIGVNSYEKKKEKAQI